MNTEKHVYELCEENPSLRDFLISKGFEQLKNDLAFRTLGKMIPLRQALFMKGMDESVFLEEFKNFSAVLLSDDSVSSSSSFESDAHAFLVSGSLPCPVRIPLTDCLLAYNERNHVKGIRYDLRSANLGLDFVLERLRSEDESLYPDLITSAGYDLLIKADIHGTISRHYMAPDIPFNEEMLSRIPNLKDPENKYHILAVVPAVFIINKKALNGRSAPHSFQELLSGDFRESVAIPVSDLDMHNALVLTIYSRYGEQGLCALKDAFAKSLHPAQMVKGVQNQAPCVSIAPYFFASMVENENQEMIWPEDGAVMSPIFLSVKKGSEQGVSPTLNYLLTDEVSDILSGNGKFPVTSLGADNHLEKNRSFLFAGWELLNDLERHLPLINRYFTL